MVVISLKFIASNVKGLQPSRKWLKTSECLRSKICPNGKLLLPETHSTFNDEVNWNDKI